MWNVINKLKKFYDVQWKPELNSFTVVLSTTFQLNEVLKPAKLQVDLIIDDEQKTMWEFKTTPAPANV